MANEEKDVLQANAGAPAANIPDLKKKEKERKRAGAAWSGARGAASEFSGAAGGTVARAAASAAGMAAEGAMVGAEGLEGGGLWAMLSRFLAGLTGTLLGKLAVAAAAFLLVAGAGLLGYEMMKGKGDAAMGSPNLGGIADSMRVRAGGDDRMGVAGKGEIAFDPQSASKPAPAAPAAPVDAKAAEAAPAPDAKADGDADKTVPNGLLAHNLSGAKLSSSMGGDFGNKNIFSGNSAAPKFGAGASSLARMGGAKGSLSAMSHPTRAIASSQSIRRGFSNKALGQAMLAKGLSQQAVQAGTAEGASSAAQGAFDQQQPVGGALNTIGAPGGDTPPSLGLGGGAPDTTLPGAPGSPSGSGTVPGLQSSLGQIGSLANQAMSNIQTGTMMAVLGGILIGIGVGLLFFPMTAVGLALIAAGTALLVMGMMKISMGKAEAKQAVAMGQQLGQSIGDVQQANAINYCTGQATTPPYTPVQNCTPPDSVTNATNQDAQNAADVQQVNQIPVTNTGIKPQ